jgi:hypothetical protein
VDLTGRWSTVTFMVLFGSEVWVWLRRLYVFSGPICDESESANRVALTVSAREWLPSGKSPG